MLRGTKHHFDQHDEEHGRQRNSPRHGRIIRRPEIRKTWIAEQNERCWQQMHKGRGNEHAGAEVAGSEQKTGRDAETRKFDGEDGEGAGAAGDEEDDEESADVEGEVVGIGVYAAAGAGGAFEAGGESVVWSLFFWGEVWFGGGCFHPITKCSKVSDVRYHDCGQDD
jgi:hypothetical protein